MGGEQEQQLDGLSQKMALPENLQQGHAAEQIWSEELEWRNLDQSKGAKCAPLYHNLQLCG